MKAKMDYQAELLYQEWHRIDVIMKGNLQRRVRRAWLAKKARIAEKKKKKAEAAEAAKKNKFGKKKRTTAVAAPTAPAMSKQPSSTTAGSPEKKVV